MNKSENVCITHIPQNFKIACGIFDFSIQRFLQLFIDHVSFYDILFETEVDPYEMASRTLSKYSFEKKEETETQLSQFYAIATKDLEKSVQAIIDMRIISLQSNLNDEQKRELAKKETESLYIHLGLNRIKSKTLYLNNEETLTLSPDFCLICEVQQISPIAHLTNLMQSISIAELEARVSLNMKVENPGMAFYLMVRNGYGNLYDNKPPRRLVFDYMDDLLELRLHLFIFRSLNYRIQKHQELLEKYYNLIT